jgi:exodeoxyribonuclease-3
MILATFNINGINQRLASLSAWLASARPDVVALQEIKCTNGDFPSDALRVAGYGAIWHGQGRNHGVAILARGATPLETRRALPGDESDREARYIEAAVDGVLIGCLYAPNGNPQPGPKFAYKLAWLERLIEHAESLQQPGVPAVLAGDYNVVPTDDDVYATRSWRDNALLQPEPRAAFARLIERGWIDALAARGPSPHAFTFWHYFRDAWPRDAGMRLDHLLANRALAPRVVRAGVDRDVRGAPHASDHAPVWIEIAGSLR